MDTPNASAPRAAQDPLTDDPFFKLTENSDWNACIGKQGTELNYLEGYAEAPLDLVKAIIEKNQFEKRDTVVLPILYSARHAIELVLKFAVNRLVARGLLKRAIPQNHDIEAYWKLLNEADLGDQTLRECIRALEPFVASLSRVDRDGQELRYHLNREEEQSLAKYSLANLEVIRDSLSKLSEIMSTMASRTLQWIDEHGDLLPNLPSFIRRVCSGYAPDRGVLRTQLV